jgi:alpha-glucosidase
LRSNPEINCEVNASMSNRYNRRQMLKTMGAASAVICLPGLPSKANPRPLRIADQDVEIQVNALSTHMIRLSLVALRAGQAMPIPVNGSLVPRSWASPTVFRHAGQSQIIKCGDLNVRISFDPLTFTITTIKNREIQRLTVDAQTSSLSFATGDSPLFGLGEGGPQFDRRGSTDLMISGQGGYQLATHGGRVPIPWLIGTSGWAMLILWAP